MSWFAAAGFPSRWRPESATLPQWRAGVLLPPRGALFLRSASLPIIECHLLEGAIEWDLDRDALEQQSNECLRAIASFLR